MTRGRKKKVVESSNSIINFAQTGIALSQSEILRKINDLNDKFTPVKAQKVIHDYIQDGGKFGSQIQEISSLFNKKNVRNLYIPLSIYGLSCEERYIIPVIDEIKKLGMYDDEETDEPKKKVKRVLDYSEIPDTAIGNFEALIDEIIGGNEVDETKLMALYTLKGSDRLQQYASVRLIDLEEDYEIFPEDYKHIPKRMYNRLVKMIGEIANANIKKQVVKKKPTTRKAKPRNLLKVLEKFKYMKEEFTELGLKSLHPTKVEGAKTAYFYDTEKKKMICMNAVPGTSLSIKGTTVYNVNESTSYRIAIRNFEKTFGKNRDFNEFNKTGLADWMNSINSKKLPIGATRTNDKMIILRTF